MDLDMVRQQVMSVLKTFRTLDLEDRCLLPGKIIPIKEKLPSQYLIYFLFVELLSFRHLGRTEKSAWYIPFIYKEKIFAIEYHKFGLRILAQSPTENRVGEEIVSLIKKSITKAKSYFESRAEQAIQTSEINVVNKHTELYERFCYFFRLYINESGLSKPITINGEHIAEDNGLFNIFRSRLEINSS
jgi:hypothetical protein